jgi:hypothetical protein
MAGKPITRAWEVKVEQFGVVRVLERVSYGDTMGHIAQSIGVSRWFLSTFLNKDRYVVSALHLCRALAAGCRLDMCPEVEGGHDVRAWVAAAQGRAVEASRALLDKYQSQPERQRSPAMQKFLADLARFSGPTPRGGGAQ